MLVSSSGPLNRYTDHPSLGRYFLPPHASSVRLPLGAPALASLVLHVMSASFNNLAVLSTTRLPGGGRGAPGKAPLQRPGISPMPLGQRKGSRSLPRLLTRCFRENSHMMTPLRLLLRLRFRSLPPLQQLQTRTSR